jgi:mono/diheme cytochrome c family protein
MKGMRSGGVPGRAPLVVLTALAAMAAAIAGCGGSGGTTTTSGGTTTAPATESATNTEGGSGEAIFQANCSSCHKLAAAEATFGTYGPDLDELKPSEAAVKTQVENGGGIMPSFGESEILTSAEIEEVSKYVAAEAGK